MGRGCVWNADYASSLRPYIRYEKPVFLISSRFRLRPQAKCVRLGLTQVLSKLPQSGGFSALANFWVEILGLRLWCRQWRHVDTFLHGSCPPCWVMATSTFHIYMLQLTLSQDARSRPCPIYYVRQTCHVRCDASITSLTAFRIHAYSASVRIILKRCQLMIA